MNFRRSVKSDIRHIMKIIKEAQQYFKEEGINQWQNNYPNEDVIYNDIENKESYVIEEDGNIIATIVISFKKEENYNNIYNGQWVTEGECGVIHRIAIDNRYKGLGYSNNLIKYVEDVCKAKEVESIKVDTHEENIPMQKLLKKNGFIYCGIIFLEDKSKRVAFEKILS